jgi:hypothetical protein
MDDTEWPPTLLEFRIDPWTGEIISTVSVP